MENKKTLILSILGVLVLIIAVVGVSFAMYSFSSTGTQTNVIETGSVSLSYSGTGSCSVGGYEDATSCEAAGGVWTSANTFALVNEYPKTDAKGLENDAYTFDVVADYEGTMSIDYALQFVDIKGTTNLTTSNVKVWVEKNINGTKTYPIAGTSATAGALMNTVASNSHTLIADGGYVFDSGFFSTAGTISYTIKAWIDEDYVLPSESNTGSCSVDGYDDADSCIAADGVWEQGKTTISEIFSFKVRVVAAQRVNTLTDANA